MITVSIVTPCYNGGRFLRQTLQSALTQTHPPLEIIVIDDGSTDDSPAVAESFGPPVRVLRQANHGESVARNKGLAEARGTHVLFLDADDLLEPAALERLALGITGRPGAVGLMGCAWFEDDPARPYSTVVASHRRFFPAIIESNLAPPHCWLTPIDVVRRAGGFYEPLRWFEDWDLWWRVGLLDPPLVPVDYVGARYRRHPGSQLATTKLADQARGHASLMTRMGAAFLDRADLLDAHGEQVFWSCWAALSRAVERGVPWGELSDLQNVLRRLAARGPAQLRRASLPRTIRIAGVRAAAALKGIRPPHRPRP